MIRSAADYLAIDSVGVVCAECWLVAQAEGRDCSQMGGAAGSLRERLLYNCLI
jgi:hypothetical protein